MKYLLGEPSNPNTPGVESFDIAGTPTHIANLNEPLAVAPESADEIGAFHLIEHLFPITIGKVLESWVRALKPGGILVIETPDLDRCIGWYLMSGDDMALKWIFGEQSREGQNHFWGWNKERLYALFENLPVKVRFAQPQSYQAEQGPVIRLEATKL